MMLKKKSLVVTMISGFVLSCVLILTLVGYAAYIELKNEESKRSYGEMSGRLNARIYEKYIEITGLEARVASNGPLRGKYIVEGTLRNRGDKDISGLLLKLRFSDKDGAVIYETPLDPTEPALGSGVIPRMNIPYISGLSDTVIIKGASMPFKKVLADCPPEMTDSIAGSPGFSKDRGRWTGRIGYEIISTELLDPEA